MSQNILNPQNRLYNFMARIKVIPADGSSKTYHLPRWRAEALVALGRADRVSSREIRVRPLTVSSEIVAAAGYDGAVSRDPADNFTDAWVVRKSGGINMWQMKSQDAPRRSQPV
jgi:hypothetical protein